MSPGGGKRPRSESLAAAAAAHWANEIIWGGGVLEAVEEEAGECELCGDGNHRGAPTHRNRQSEHGNNCWSFSLELNINPLIIFKVFPRRLQIQILIELTFILMKHM